MIVVHDKGLMETEETRGSKGAVWKQRAAANHYWRREQVMKAIMFLKLVIATAVVLVLVMIGLNNRAPVDFNLPLVLTQAVTQPAALMYFGFFAVGLVTGAILCIPSKPRGKSGKAS